MVKEQYAKKKKKKKNVTRNIAVLVSLVFRATGCSTE